MLHSPTVRNPRRAESLKHEALAVIGLIGGIGSGKSSVSKLFERAGAVVVDADRVGHELLNDHQVQDEIRGRFGPSVFSGNGGRPAEAVTVDRKALAAVVFGDAAARRDLELILHPRMRAWFVELVDRESRSNPTGRKMVVLDAAILLEAGWDDLCDWIVYVDAPREERMRRVALQRRWSPGEFEARERAQWPCDEKRVRADFVVANDAAVGGLQAEVERVVARLAELSFPLIETSNSS